jgi:hypothetical protein
MLIAEGGGQRQQRGGGGERAGPARLRAGRQDSLPSHHAAHPHHAPVTGTHITCSNLEAYSPPKLSYGPWIGPRGPHVLKTTHGPLIDTALYVMLLMRANPLIGQVGGGWALEISTVFGPQNGSHPNG